MGAAGAGAGIDSAASSSSEISAVASLSIYVMICILLNFVISCDFYHKVFVFVLLSRVQTNRGSVDAMCALPILTLYLTLCVVFV